MKVEEFIFAESGGVPNNPRLPVLVYRQAIDVTENAAARIEERFRANGWCGLWRNGVFAHHHYHCGAHEVLGIAEGRARLLIGGPGGREVEVAAGDVILLPAGTGHRRGEASGDFLVIGGYPPEQHASLRPGSRRRGSSRHPLALRNACTELTCEKVRGSRSERLSAQPDRQVGGSAAPGRPLFQAERLPGEFLGGDLRHFLGLIDVRQHIGVAAA
ncbi:cupin domain-containing protein [Sinorhizobium medicae]|uniref:cupin domain-containing protein n=1 Tax=Sinorhizobium medicae TaxID=110321 RepID=UPI003B51C2C9